MSIASSCGRMAEGTSLVQIQKRPSEHRQLMECLRFPLENDQIPCIPTASTGIYYPTNQFPHGLRAGHCYFCMEAPAPSWTMFPVEKRCWSARSGTGVIGGRSRVPSEKRLPEPDERVFFLGLLGALAIPHHRRLYVHGLQVQRLQHLVSRSSF